MIDQTVKNFRRFIPENITEGKIAFDNEILRCTVGSELHGTGLPGTEDHDEMGVYIEPPELVLGFKKMEHFIWRSKPEGVRSEHGDTDLTLYSLRKYMGLAIQGNPSILLLLFAPDEFTLFENEFGKDLRNSEFLGRLISKKAGPRFLGYFESQKLRFLGEKHGHTPRRTDLIEQFGYDTKYAMHAMRLGLQGIELMREGHLTLPVPGKNGHFLRGIRRGEYSKEEVLYWMDVVEERLKRAIDESLLPEEPDYKWVEKWIIALHMDWWQQNEL